MTWTRETPGDLTDTEGEFTFELHPETDRDAWAALWEYASRVERRSPNLAAQIKSKLSEISGNNP